MKSSAGVLRAVYSSILLSAMAGSAMAASNYRAESLSVFTPLDVVSAISPTGIAVGQGIFSDYPDTAVIWDAAGNVSGVTNQSPAVDINALGQILLTNKILSSDGTFISVSVPSAAWELTGINDVTQVAGYRWLGYSGGVHTYGAFLWQNGVLTDLPALPNGGSTYSSRINNQGIVIGHAITSAGETHAVMWKGGAIVDLGTLPGDTYSSATGINDLGQIVGYSYAVGKPSRGFIWDNGEMSAFTGVPSDLSITPMAINDNGLVTGFGVQSAGRTIAFAWNNGVIRDLTPVMSDVGYGCYAFDVNNAGQIVGQCGYRNVRITPTTDATDVGVEVIGASSSATVGTPYSYTVKVSNVGALSASGVTLTDSISAGASFVSAVSSQGSCSTSLPLTCTFGDLASDATVDVQLTVIPTVAGPMTSSAMIATNEVDANTLNNIATHSVSVKSVVTPVISADLSVAISGPSSTKLRSNFTYTMTVKNNGPAEAKTVTLTNNLAANLYLVASSTTQGSCAGTSCSLGTLASGATATLKMTVKPLARGTFTSNSSVSFSGTDSNNANNTATITTVVK